MIPNLAKRAEFWSKRWSAESNAGTEPFPFAPWMKHVRGKSVMEIGAGERQSGMFLGLADSYVPCDLLGAGPATRCFEDYSVDYHQQFDCVTFWYVLHHVPTAELGDFLRFAARHVAPSGALFFNRSETTRMSDLGDDGFRTTVHDPAKIAAILSEEFFLSWTTRHFHEVTELWQRR